MPVTLSLPVDTKIPRCRLDSRNQKKLVLPQAFVEILHIGPEIHLPLILKQQYILVYNFADFLIGCFYAHNYDNGSIEALLIGPVLTLLLLLFNTKGISLGSQRVE